MFYCIANKSGLRVHYTLSTDVFSGDREESQHYDGIAQRVTQVIL